MTTYARPFGSGVGGLYAANDRFTLDDGNQVKVAIDKLSLGALQGNIWMGGFAFIGGEGLGVDVNADGDVDLLDPHPVRFDNTSSHFSGFTDTNGATLVIQVRFKVRVSDVAISATPKIRHGATETTMTTVTTISGAAACSATSNAYTGANQMQTITITLPSGVNFFKPQLTVASTGGNPYQVWGMATWDAFIQNTI